METGLKGKSVIVTGGGSNIGKGIVLAFAKEGAKVAIADIDETQSQKVAAKAKEVGAEAALTIKTDVTRSEDVQRMVGAVLNAFGRIDVLVNNAGIWNTAVFTEETDAEVDKQINVNLKGPINCAKAVLPIMIESQRGRIINIGSEAGRAGDPDKAVYSATKGAIISLTRAVARHVGKYEITVNCVCPHAIGPDNLEEDIGEGSAAYATRGRTVDAATREEIRKKVTQGHALSRTGKPGDIAAAVVFFASDGAGYITGQTLNVNGGDTMS